MISLMRNIREFGKNKAAMSGLIVICVLIMMALSAEVISPYDPTKIKLEEKLQPPSWEHIMGTDHLGRDVLTRIIYGCRVTFQFSIIVVTITAIVGVTVGIVSGYCGGVVDEILMRFVDILLAFPSIILALVVIGALGPGISNTILAISFVGWLSYARVSRGSTLSIKAKEFIESARSMGSNNIYIMYKHVYPNVLYPIIVLATLHMGSVILTVAALGFLGLGAQPPTPEWGTMLNEGKEFLRVCPWLSIFPGLMIMLTVLAFNFIGDGLRDALDPRMKEVMMK